jgi:hypothetical protein
MTSGRSHRFLLAGNKPVRRLFFAAGTGPALTRRQIAEPYELHMPEQDLSELTEALRTQTVKVRSGAVEPSQVQGLSSGNQYPFAVGSLAEPIEVAAMRAQQAAQNTPEAVAQAAKRENQAHLDADLSALGDLIAAIERTKQALITHHARQNEHIDNCAQLRNNAHEMVRVIGASLENFVAKINGDHQ